MPVKVNERMRRVGGCSEGTEGSLSCPIPSLHANAGPSDPKPPAGGAPACVAQLKPLLKTAALSLPGQSSNCTEYEAIEMSIGTCRQFPSLQLTRSNLTFESQS